MEQSTSLEVNTPAPVDVLNPATTCNNNNNDTTKEGVPAVSAATAVVDGVKLRKEKHRSLFDEKYAQIKERRKANEIKMEQEVMEKLKKNEEIFANYEKKQAMKKQQLKELSLKKDSKRKEIEQRKEQLLEENKKKTEALLAKSEEQTQVTLRKKKRPVDTKKRWSWSTSGGWGASGGVIAMPLKSSPSQQDLNDPNKKREAPVFVEQKFSTRSSITDLTHISFAQGLRSYDSSSSNHTSLTNLSEPTLPFNSRLLTPTKASLAKSVRSEQLRSSESFYNNDRSRSVERRDKKTSPPIRTSLSAHKMNGIGDKKKFVSMSNISTTTPKNDSKPPASRKSITPRMPQKTSPGSGETPQIKRSLHPSNTRSLFRPKQSPGLPRESTTTPSPGRNKPLATKPPKTSGLFKKRDKSSDVKTDTSSSVTSSTSSRGGKQPLKAMTSSTSSTTPKRSSSVGRSYASPRSSSVEKKSGYSRPPSAGSSRNNSTSSKVGSRSPSTGRSATPRSPSVGRRSPAPLRSTTTRSPPTGRASSRQSSATTTPGRTETKKTEKLKELKKKEADNKKQKDDDKPKVVEQEKPVESPKVDSADVVENPDEKSATAAVENIEGAEEKKPPVEVVEAWKVDGPSINNTAANNEKEQDDKKLPVEATQQLQPDDPSINNDTVENNHQQHSPLPAANKPSTNNNEDLLLVDLELKPSQVVCEQKEATKPEQLPNKEEGNGFLIDVGAEKTENDENSKENCSEMQQHEGTDDSAKGNHNGSAEEVIDETTEESKVEVAAASNEIEQPAEISNDNAANDEEASKVVEENKVQDATVETAETKTSSEVNGSGEVKTAAGGDEAVNGKEERKLTELETFQITLAAKRREAKERREKEALAHKERLKLQAEEQARMAEEARKMAEDAAAEQQKQEEEEMAAKSAAQDAKTEEDVQHFIKKKKDEIEQRAKAESEKQKRKIEEEKEKQEQARLKRKLRLEKIMKRTRGGDTKSNEESAAVAAAVEPTTAVIKNEATEEIQQQQGVETNNNNNGTTSESNGDDGMLFRRVLTASTNNNTDDDHPTVDNDVTIVDVTSSVVEDSTTTSVPTINNNNNSTTTLVQ